MMNTKRFLMELNTRVTQSGEDGKAVIDLIKLYSYQCASMAKMQKNKRITRDHITELAYIYYHKVGACLKMLRIFGLISYKEDDEFTEHLAYYIRMYSDCPF